MSEKLIEQKKPVPQIPMAARAVALCEGCPMAKFCVVKDVAPCETTAVKEMHIDASGGYDSPTIDKPIRTSYRGDLFDPAKLTVMAELQKKKEQQQVQTKPVARTANPTLQPMKKAEQPKPPRAAPARVTAKPTRERQTESEADLIAGIFMSMIGVKGIATARAQKSV